MQRRRPDLADILLASPLMVGLVLFLRLSARSLTAYSPIWFEGPVAGFMAAIRDGRLYQMAALHSPPYSVLTHTPLSYLIDYGVYSLWPGYPPLRLINLVLTWLCAVLIAWLVRKESGGFGSGSLLAAALFLVFPPVFFWSQVARSPDSLACLLSLATLAVLKYMPPSRRREILVGVLFALAVLSKQSAAVPLGAVVFLYALYPERNLPALRWRLLGAAGVIVPVCGSLQLASRGGFWLNVVGANMIRMEGDWWLRTITSIDGFWLFAALVLSTGVLEEEVISVWALATLLFGLFGVAKRGSDTMYFFDSAAALAILAARALRRAGDRRLALAGTLAMALAVIAYEDRGLLARAEPQGELAYSQMIGFLRANTRGPLLTDDAGIDVELKRQPVWDDPFIFAEWSAQNRWSAAALVAEVREGRFSAIVLSGGFLVPQAVIEEVHKRYGLARVFHTRPLARCVFLPDTEDAAVPADESPPACALPGHR